MNISVFPLGMLQTNCYVLESKNGNGIVIDPGENAHAIMSFIKDNSINLCYILLTHGHFDHIAGVDLLKDNTKAKTYIHGGDVDIFTNPACSGTILFDDFSNYSHTDPDNILIDGDIINLDDISLKVMHTKGHTKGSVLFIGKEIIFSGDTLFEGTVGRTDLYGGSMEEMKESIEKIKKLDDSYTVLPGHGNSTTIKQEKISNPYMGTNYDNIF